MYINFDVYHPFIQVILVIIYYSPALYSKHFGIQGCNKQKKSSSEGKKNKAICIIYILKLNGVLERDTQWYLAIGRVKQDWEGRCGGRTRGGCKLDQKVTCEQMHLGSEGDGAMDAWRENSFSGGVVSFKDQMCWGKAQLLLTQQKILSTQNSRGVARCVVFPIRNSSF